MPGFRRPRSASAERSGDDQGKKRPFVQGQHPQNEIPHIQFQGMSRALSNQQSASSYQPTIVRLRRCCLPLLNLVRSCVHAVPILLDNNRTLVLMVSRGKCRREGAFSYERSVFGGCSPQRAPSASISSIILFRPALDAESPRDSS